MMTSFYFQDQNAVSGLYCQANFSNCLFIPKREDEFEKESILTKHSGLGSKMTPSCKWPIMERLSLRAGCSVDMARGLNIGLCD